MLIGEYDYETDIAVQRAEERESAFAQGITQGRSEGIVQGAYQKALETAKILKQLGDSVQKIVQVTGLTVQEVERLKS